MFPEPTELLLIGDSIESIWTPKSKSNTLTPKTNSQTCGPREISHVMNGIIFCVCNIAISVLQFVLKRWQKEYNKIQGKKESQRSRGQWWALLQGPPSTLSSSASESPVKRSCESQRPWSAKAEKNDRTGQPVVDQARHYWRRRRNSR